MFQRLNIGEFMCFFVCYLLNILFTFVCLLGDFLKNF